MGALADFIDGIALDHGDFIRDAGKVVTVRDRDGSLRYPTVLVQPLQPDQIQSLNLEGSYNVLAGRPTVFTFPGDDAIPETGAVIIDDGWEWEVKDMPKTPGSVLYLNKSVLCTRKKLAT
jgi:hypothetical protein